ncbi:membrane protein insertase YidC [uncultured Tessaracoccus sp.]|uniref:membrane protein insertase YidC n=1 Tax=uncultured Tessaracoccus sp. TaxID=905023 RepID=UPI0025D7AEC7|nr:membrane protein insertase YidC [uncultured Tessaracoccus sp.]
MTTLFVTLGIWDGFYALLSQMMQPLYWAVSGLLVLFHWVWGAWLALPRGAAWALAIVSLTVLVRTLMIPLFVKQINSARNMQLLQPKIQALQKKYGSDRERLGQETMKLYREEGVNPMASCLPLLIQMPIFLSLFRVLQGASDGNVRGQWLKDRPDLVASLQDAQLFGAGLADRIFPISPVGPTQIVGVILVICMVAALFVTQLQLMRKNMTPEAMEGPMAQQQKMMLYVFPVLYAASAVVIPIGVLLYWLASNVWTMGQQGILIRNNPAPNTPAYIDWEERMRARGKDPDEIMRQRREKTRRKRGLGTSHTTRHVRGQETATVDGGEAGDSTTEKPRVQRQNVTRSTVRTDADGRRVVVRQQPRQRSRAQRKKK